MWVNQLFFVHIMTDFFQITYTCTEILKIGLRFPKKLQNYLKVVGFAQLWKIIEIRRRNVAQLTMGITRLFMEIRFRPLSYYRTIIE